MEHLPPIDLEAEKALLASLLLCDGDMEAWQACLGVLREATWAQADHGIIWDCMSSLRRAGKDVDGLSVTAELDRRNLRNEVGGTAYLGQILNSVPSWLHWRTYLAIVLDTHQRRELLRIATEITANAMRPRVDVEAGDIAAAAARKLADVVGSGSGAGYRIIGDLAIEVYDGIESAVCSYVPSGFDELDRLIGGFGHGEFWLLGARPSMGKSTFCRQLALGVARLRLPVAYISLEETPQKMTRNLLAAECGIENSKLRRGGIAPQEWTEIAAGVQKLSGVELYISDTARRLNDIKALATTLQARHGVQLLIVDYLQRIRGARASDRFEAVTELSIEMSDLAKTTRLAVLCPVQLNRQNEGRQDKRPNLSDLRESGQLEQDADGVLFLHREDYYRRGEYDHEAELIVAKNRDGVRGVTIRFRTDLRYQRFEEKIYQEAI